MIKNIKINNLTHKVIMKKEDRFIGIKGENKYETLKFTFEDEFLNGEGILEIQKPNSQKEYIILDKEEDCYLLEVKNSLLNLEGEITMQLVIRLTDNKVFKSVEFTMQVLKAIEATTEIPDEYETWDSTLAAKILEIDSKLSEITSLEEDLTDKVESGYFKGDKGDTGEPGQNGTNGIDGQDGVDGFSPTVSTQLVENGVQVTITDINGSHTFMVLNGQDGQVDEQMVAQAVQTYLEQNPIEVPSKTSDLTNDSNFVADANYVHTDNNYTTQEKQKLAGLSNYDDTEVNQAIANKVDKVTGKDLSTNDFDDTYKTNVDDNTDARHTHTNKQVLDNITSNDVNNWNNKSDFSGSYNDLSNKPTIPSEVTENTVSNWGFTKNTGTITGITMNGVSKGTSGVVDLGTVITQHQDISGKFDTTKVKNANSTTAGDVYDVRYINSMIGNIETLLQEV